MKMTVSILAIITFLSLPIINAQAQPDPFSEKDVPVLRWKSNIESDSYSKIIDDDFGEKITELSKFSLDNLTDIMPTQTGFEDERPGWFLPNLVGLDGSKVTLSLRADNLYWTSFENGNGDWYSFKGLENLVPGSIPLDIDCSYGENGFGGFEGLKTVPLNRKRVLQAFDTLHSYDPVYTDKQDLRTLLLALVEPIRFKPAYQPIADGWDGEEDVYIKDISFLQYWAGWCCKALLGWKSEEFRDEWRTYVLKHGITEKKDALMKFFGRAFILGKKCEKRLLVDVYDRSGNPVSYITGPHVAPPPARFSRIDACC